METRKRENEKENYELYFIKKQKYLYNKARPLKGQTQGYNRLSRK